MGKEGDIDADVIDGLWTIGWYGKETFGALFVLSIAIFFTNIPGWVGGLGLLTAFVLPPVAVVYVRLNWKEVRDAGLEQTRDAVSDVVIKAKCHGCREEFATFVSVGRDGERGEGVLNVASYCDDCVNDDPLNGIMVWEKTPEQIIAAEEA